MLYRCGTPSGGGGSELVKTGTYAVGSSTENFKITTGWKPKHVTIWYAGSGNRVVLMYDEDYATTSYARSTYTKSSNTSNFTANQPFTSMGQAFISIDDDGFTVRSSTNRTWHYVAIG